MPDSIDAPIFLKQRTDRESVPDLGRSDPRSEQFGAGDNTM